MRVGIGYDSHRLANGRKLILGGVHIPFDKGLEGHSDADVLLHALIDALLGAAGLGDIGRLFPDTDPRLAGADSRKMLRQVAERLRDDGWRLGNADMTVVAQAPRLSDFMDRMQSNMAADLGVEEDRINVKAKTAEGMGPMGRGEGIEACAVVLIDKAAGGEAAGG